MSKVRGLGYLKTSKGAYEHREVAKGIVGRDLKDGEVVHHIDKNKRNNQPNNLRVYKSQFWHNLNHQIQAVVFGKGYSFQGRKGFRYYAGWIVLALLGIGVLKATQKTQSSLSE